MNFSLPEDTITYRWEQVVGAGPILTLTGGNTKTARFTAPSVEVILTFKLTTSNAVGSSEDLVVIKVAAVITERDTVGSIIPEGEAWRMSALTIVMCTRLQSSPGMPRIAREWGN